MQRSTATLCVGDGVLIYFGERSHLLNKDINLDTHITNTVNVIKWEDLNDICLVVHSYGGWVGSGVSHPTAEAAAHLRQRKRPGLCRLEADPQPVGTYAQAIRLSGAREKIAKKAHIRATKFPNPAFDKALAECKTDPAWNTFEINAYHIVMLDEPEWLADTLMKVA